MVLVMAAINRFPVAELIRNETLWGGGVCIAGVGWLRRRVPGSAHAARRHEHRGARGSGCSHCGGPGEQGRL
jgi:hypothetical protein